MADKYYASAGFQSTASKVFKRVIDRTAKQTEAAMEEISSEVVEALRTKSNALGAYKGNQGVGVQAEKRSQHSMAKWYKYRNKRTSANSIGYIFKNNAESSHNKTPYPYVNSIYGTDSDGRAFRSKQLSEGRWKSFKAFVKDAMAEKVKFDLTKGVIKRKKK